MNAIQIYRGYIHQLMYGCDAVVCDNEYCRSCPNFKFQDQKDIQQIGEIAKDLLKQHSKKSNLCKNLARYHYDPTFFTDFKFPKMDDFRNIKNLNKKEIETFLEDEKHFPYLFLDIPSDIAKLNENPYYFNDVYLKTIYDAFDEDPEFFYGWPEIIYQYIIQFDSYFSQKSQTSPKIITYHLLRCVYMCLFLISLFQTNDYAPLLRRILLNVFCQDQNEILTNFLLKAYSQTPQVVNIILDYLQDNITFASILNDNFSHDLPQNPDYANSLKPEIRYLASFIELLRNSNPNMPTICFVNEVFTDNFVAKFEYDDLVYYLNNHFSYLQCPSILTLKWKTEMLKTYFKFIQKLYARSELEDREEDLHPEELFFSLVVRRDHLIQDAIMKLNSTPPADFMKTLRVIFQGEQGVDAGGVSREFFHLVCNEIFHVKYGMFQQTPSGKYWFVSILSCEPINFQLIGTIVGLAIYNAIILPIRFPLLLYKKLWNVPLKLDDYAEIDPDIVNSLKSLKKMKETNPQVDFSEMDLMFYITQDYFGAAKEIPLCEGGLEKQVTNDNLDEYIELYTNWLLNDSIKIPYDKFAYGFHKVIDAPSSGHYKPLNIKKLIAYDEADILVSGEEIIHWDLLKENCLYSDGYTKDSRAVKFFWEIFDEMTANEKQLFFRFSTGSDRAPVGGLQKFELTIQKVNDITKLPVSHTCFNIFSLPDYPTKEEMKKKVLISIAHSEGFGLI